MHGLKLAAGIFSEAERIEREKDGKALMADEAQTLRAAQFLKAIWPPDTRLPVSGDLGILKPDGVK